MSEGLAQVIVGVVRNTLVTVIRIVAVDSTPAGSAIV